MKVTQNIQHSRISLILGIIGTIAMFLVLVSCGNDDEGTTRLNVRLTDAPGDYQEVNIDIQGVEVKRGTDDGENGWTAIELETGIYNLLDYTNGLDTLIGSADLPSGRISQIRLILGNENSVRVNDVNWGLTTPSAQQSGLKLNVHADLKDGVEYTLLLDFDAAKSIVQNGSGYKLKPVIRVITAATSGAILGEITPLASSPAILVISGLDTLATTFPNEFGGFLLRGVPAGTYSVSFNTAAGYQSSSIDGVMVTIGNVTNLGVVTLNIVEL